MGEVPLYCLGGTSPSEGLQLAGWNLHVQELLEHKVHPAVGAYIRPLPIAVVLSGLIQTVFERSDHM